MHNWFSQALSDEHDITKFDCGNEALNAWLVNQALRAQRSDTARTFVWTAPPSREVVAYYSVAPTQIVRSEISSGQAGGSSVVPAYLLARLALDHALQGQQLDSELLVDALQTIVMAGRAAAGRLIVVDAIDDAAAAFYRHYDFQPLKDDNPRRLVMKLATARQALGHLAVQVASSAGAGLVSMTLELPSGVATPVVMSKEELYALISRLDHAVTSRGKEPVRINLSSLIKEALGRDPFAG